VIAELVEGMCAESISRTSIQQIKLEFFSTESIQKKLNILKIPDEVASTTFYLNILDKEKVFDTISALCYTFNKLKSVPL